MATRYFEKNDAKKPVEIDGKTIKFREVEFEHGKWYGVIALSDPEEIEALLSVAAKNGVREMSREDYRKKEEKKRPRSASISLIDLNQRERPNQPANAPAAEPSKPAAKEETASIDDVLTLKPVGSPDDDAAGDSTPEVATEVTAEVSADSSEGESEPEQPKRRRGRKSKSTEDAD